jgi:2-polyprenyl-3-methyl-5-hydroxy-6-metoxy-1,4-benzoquinol methylase
MRALTTKDYWTNHWEKSPYRLVSLDSHFDFEFFKLFSRINNRLNHLDKIQILEVGCGNSAWLPFLNKTFGWEITGLDYNELGVNRSNIILKEMGVKGIILKRDLFEDNTDLMNNFDIVYSAGFVEHFDDLEKVILNLKKFLKPNGYILKTVPNLFNYSTIICKIVGNKILSVHKLINLEELVNGHELNGFETIDCRYVGFGGTVVPDTYNLLSKLYVFINRKCFGLVRKTIQFLNLDLPINRKTATIIAYIGKLS